MNDAREARRKAAQEWKGLYQERKPLVIDVLDGGRAIRIHGDIPWMGELPEMLDQLTTDDPVAADLLALAKKEKGKDPGVIAVLADRLEELGDPQAEDARAYERVARLACQHAALFGDSASGTDLPYDQTFRPDVLPSEKQLRPLIREQKALFTLAKFYRIRGVSARWGTDAIMNAFDYTRRGLPRPWPPCS